MRVGSFLLSYQYVPADVSSGQRAAAGMRPPPRDKMRRCLVTNTETWGKAGKRRPDVRAPGTSEGRRKAAL